MPNEVPVEYFCTLDADGRRRDTGERPELSGGTVEYVAPAEYMVRPPMPPVYVFVIDVSYAAVSSGMLATVCAAILACLDKLPGDERTQVGVLTYDSALHFYNLKSSLSAPQQLVVAEVDDPFLPLPEELLVNLRDSRQLVDALLTALPANFATTTCVEAAMGPALQAAFLVSSHVGGKMLLFAGSPASLGVGRIKSRENPSLYNTEREASLRQPEEAFFKRFAAECSRVQITLDVFIATDQYTDLASLAAIPRFTCGQLCYYPRFAASRDGAKLHAEVVRNLTRATAWEAVMRIRCSKGLRISSFHGHFFNRSTDLLALPTCDPDKGFAVQVAHEETVLAGSVAYVQCALLYTSSNGERRIRVHTLSLPVVSELSELYNAADGAACAALLAKLAVEKSLSARLDDARNVLQTKVTQALKEYRLLHAAHVRGANRLIYPDTLRYLPLWALGAMKTAALRGGGKDVAADERMAVGHELSAANTAATLRLAYPTVYALAPEDTQWGAERDGQVSLPLVTAACSAYFSDRSAFLLDNGRLFILWLGRALPPAWLADVFDLDPAQLPPDFSHLAVEPARRGPVSQRLNTLLGALRTSRGTYAQTFVVAQGSALEAHVVPFLVEDRSAGQMSYQDFMLQLHRSLLK